MQDQQTSVARPARKKKRRATRTRSRTRVRCQLCSRLYVRITARHLKTHGYTLARYQRTFVTGCAPAAHLLPSGPAGGGPLEPAPAAVRALAAQVAEGLVENDGFVAALSDEVGELIFTSSLRDRLRLALCGALSKRLELVGRAHAQLALVQEELAEPWRLDAGGKGHGPTPTRDLVGMAGELHHQVTKGEEALMKTVKLALEEGRTHKERLGFLAGRPAFQGSPEGGEIIDVPPELTSGERETVRGLLSMLKEEMGARAQQRAQLADRGAALESARAEVAALEASRGVTVEESTLSEAVRAMAPSPGVPHDGTPPEGGGAPPSPFPEG